MISRLIIEFDFVRVELLILIFLRFLRFINRPHITFQNRTINSDSSQNLTILINSD